MDLRTDLGHPHPPVFHPIVGAAPDDAVVDGSGTGSSHSVFIADTNGSGAVVPQAPVDPSNKTDTTIGVTSLASNPSVAAESLTFTASVSPSAASGTVTFTDTTSSTVLGTSFLNPAGQASIITTSLTLAGAHSITAVYNGDALYKTSTSTAFRQDVNPAAAAKLAFVQQPADAMAGVVIAPAATVQVQDSFGNGIPGSGVPITLTLTTGTGALSGTNPQLTNGSGLASFDDLRVNLAGSKKLTASMAGLTSVDSSSFSVTVSGSIVFMTESDHFGNLGGLDGAHAMCNAEAAAALLSGTFKAWLSDDTTSAASRLTHSTNPYRVVDGTLVANNWTNLTDGSLAFPMGITPFGIFPFFSYIRELLLTALRCRQTA